MGQVPRNQVKGFINWIQNSIQNDADNTLNSFAVHLVD
jgi:hypothetical protein